MISFLLQVRDGSRTATYEEMKEGVMLYYLDCCPEKATSEAVDKLLKSFVGREKKLHGGLKKKYGRAPEVLLRAPRPKGIKKSPKEWSRKKIIMWVKKILLVYAAQCKGEEQTENDTSAATDAAAAAAVTAGGTDAGTGATGVVVSTSDEVSYDLSESFNCTGSQMYSLSVHDIIRRCGGGSSCAGFNSEENSLYDSR